MGRTKQGDTQSDERRAAQECPDTPSVPGMRQSCGIAERTSARGERNHVASNPTTPFRRRLQNARAMGARTPSEAHTTTGAPNGVRHPAAPAPF